LATRCNWRLSKPLITKIRHLLYIDDLSMLCLASTLDKRTYAHHRGCYGAVWATKSYERILYLYASHHSRRCHLQTLWKFPRDPPSSACGAGPALVQWKYLDRHNAALKVLKCWKSWSWWTLCLHGTLLRSQSLCTSPRSRTRIGTCLFMQSMDHAAKKVWAAEMSCLWLDNPQRKERTGK